MIGRLSPLLHGLTEPEMTDLLRSASTRNLARGEFYSRATPPLKRTFGRVKLFRTTPDGRNTGFYVVTPTEAFSFSPPGWPGQRVHRPTSAEVLEDARALMWPFEQLVQAMLAHRTFTLNVLRLIAERHEAVTHHLQNLAEMSVETRLAQIVVRHAQSMGHTTPEGIVVRAALTGRDLAELTVSRILASWRRQKVVNASRGRIVIQDAKRLAYPAGIAVWEDRTTPQ